MLTNVLSDFAPFSWEKWIRENRRRWKSDNLRHVTGEWIAMHWQSLHCIKLKFSAMHSEALKCIVCNASANADASIGCNASANADASTVHLFFSPTCPAICSINTAMQPLVGSFGGKTVAEQSVKPLSQSRGLEKGRKARAKSRDGLPSGEAATKLTRGSSCH